MPLRERRHHARMSDLFTGAPLRCPHERGRRPVRLQLASQDLERRHARVLEVRSLREPARDARRPALGRHRREALVTASAGPSGLLAEDELLAGIADDETALRAETEL